jgi:hypothetical protein
MGGLVVLLVDRVDVVDENRVAERDTARSLTDRRPCTLSVTSTSRRSPDAASLPLPWAPLWPNRLGRDLIDGEALVGGELEQLTQNALPVGIAVTQHGDCRRRTGSRRVTSGNTRATKKSLAAVQWPARRAPRRTLRRWQR